MNYSLISLFISVILCSELHAQHVQRDLLNETSVNYEDPDLSFENAALDLLEDIAIIEIEDKRWKGAEAINRLIKKDAEYLLTKDFKEQFYLEYRKAIHLHIDEWTREVVIEEQANYDDIYQGIVDYYEPSTVDATYTILSLCDHILVAGFNISFEAMRGDYRTDLRDLQFQMVHYYDLNKGIEIDPKSIIDSKQRKEFHRLIKARVPDHFKGSLDSIRVDEGYPIFMGGGFYYVLHGAIEAWNEDQLILQVRLPIEEVQEYLDPKGPFAAYAKLDLPNSADEYCIYPQVRYYDHPIVAPVMQILQREAFEAEVHGKNLMNRTALIQYGEHGAQELNFDKNGNLKMIRTRIYHKERNYSEDSVAYNRRRDGALKSIEVYELVDVYDPELDDEVDEFTLDQLYLFDRNERLIRFEDSDQWNDFDGYREMEILNFTYLKNKVITDVGYRTKRSEGFLLESYEYLNVSGFCKEISYSDDKDVPSYRVEKNLDTMVLFLSYNDKETRNASYLVENGRLVDVKQFNESNWLHIEYNEDNQPVHMIKRRKLKEGYSPAFETFIEYNVQGLPIKFTSDVQVGDQELNVPRPFEITWK